VSRPNGDFMDSNNIIIVNDVPYYSYNGKSYLEKLKNGLSIDYVFSMEDVDVKPEEKLEECVALFEEKQYQPFKHELFAEEYDNEILPRTRKGKKVIKKRCDKNMKKNNVKQNGYDDKLHNIEVNLPSIWDPDFDCNEYYNSDYITYNNIPSDSDFEDFEAYLDYYGSAIFNKNHYDRLDEWNNTNQIGV
jgi:hypothetical protein